MDELKRIEPVYLRTFKEGLLDQKIKTINETIRKCTVCPHKCMNDRLKSHSGKCRSGHLPVVSSFGPHFGEEPPLSGFNGSGTIFFGNCNLACLYCQNYDISQGGTGEELSYNHLAGIMIHLQNQGCHNINFVTPTHLIHAILNALPDAIEMGLNIPLVYNSGGYDLVSTIRLLDGVIDIYMPDIKYMDNDIAYKHSGIENYVQYATASILEMHRQVGDLFLDNNGIAQKGLIIRHLILPDNLADTYKTIDFVKSISSETFFNLMDQYHPVYQAGKIKKINRRITRMEYQSTYNYAISIGLNPIAN